MAAPEPASSRAGSTPNPLGRNQAEQLAQTLRTIADPTRLQLLSMLNASAHGGLVVGELAERLDLTQPTVSHHLKIMTDDGLLIREQRGRYVWYAISSDRKDSISDLLR